MNRHSYHFTAFAFALALPLASASCFDTNTELCESGLRCAVGFECRPAESGVEQCFAAGCGDGIVDPGEICDDSNNSDGDGCSAGCLLESNIKQGECLVVSDVTEGDGSDVLLIVDTNSSDPVGDLQQISLTTVDDVDAVAIQPLTGTLFGAHRDQLGFINTQSGEFIATRLKFGTGSGADSSVQFDDVDGLAFDPIGGILYASVRRVGASDLLIILDDGLGQHVAEAFGNNTDYVQLSGSGTLQDIVDIEDIAIDSDGQMYGIAGSDGGQQLLVRIDKATGAMTEVGSTMANDIEGMDFDGMSRLWGSAASTQELFNIDTGSGMAFPVVSLVSGTFTGFGAIDCE